MSALGISSCSVSYFHRDIAWHVQVALLHANETQLDAAAAGALASKAGQDEKYAKRLQKGDEQLLFTFGAVQSPNDPALAGFQDLVLAWSWGAKAALQQYSSSQRRVVPSSACQLLQQCNLKAMESMDEQHCRLQKSEDNIRGSN